VNPVGVADPRQLRIVIEDEEGAEGVGDAAEGAGGAFDLGPSSSFSRSWTMSAPPLSAARSSASRSPGGRASQTK